MRMIPQSKNSKNSDGMMNKQETNAIADALEAIACALRTLAEAHVPSSPEAAAAEPAGTSACRVEPEYFGTVVTSRMLGAGVAAATPMELKLMVRDGVFSEGSVIRKGKRLMFLPEAAREDIIRYRRAMTAEEAKHSSRLKKGRGILA